MLAGLLTVSGTLLWLERNSAFRLIGSYALHVTAMYVAVGLVATGAIAF